MGQKNGPKRTVPNGPKKRTKKNRPKWGKKWTKMGEIIFILFNCTIYRIKLMTFIYSSSVIFELVDFVLSISSNIEHVLFLEITRPLPFVEVFLKHSS